ncbi:nuclease A inhibitor family protein [Gloeobacter kilaueensis]|uniref:Sugar-non-specific nuclease inhibitor NuiA n=1 Tax=Gloeobacter kilaueensis (strain ATCC BAA-2537 / CCAP 1431/1 / ULC 316 / JS1) TaxID=1183438 RepID=U5QNL6_GLOK1|nr:nuclease A inhibitor family protein [Gloeobacter kilaueensis]AGY59265.1 sugar-non-specific nuclease inhibitor NuiA [Gloeobacter kilaueensis JS1]
MSEEQSADDPAALLQEAAAGLIFISESEAPFRALRWPVATIDSAQLLKRTGHATGMRVRKLALREFFSSACREEDWYGPEEQQTAARFRHLVQTIEQNLNDVQVYRVGDTEADIYIVGRNRKGTLSGLSTQVVET